MTNKEKIAKLITEWRKTIMENKYFMNVDKMNTPQQFEPMCIDLYHLANEFLNLITIRHDRFKDEPEEIFESHVQEETGHADMLRKWMLQMGMVDPTTKRPSLETETYISILYRAAATMSKNLSLLLINGCGEGTAQDFYGVTYNRLKELGFPKLAYWHLHAEVDQEHGDIMHLIPELSDVEYEETKYFCNTTLQIINNMKESWAA